MHPYRSLSLLGAATVLLLFSRAAIADDRIASTGMAPIDFPPAAQAGPLAVPMEFPVERPAVEPPGVQPLAVELEVPVRPVIEIGRPVDAGRLAGMRGGADTVETTIVIEGIVDNNTASQIVTGSNSINEGSFANANGLNTVIQNTGANVLIQNAMSVQVEFVAPGP